MGPLPRAARSRGQQKRSRRVTSVKLNARYCSYPVWVKRIPRSFLTINIHYRKFTPPILPMACQPAGFIVIRPPPAHADLLAQL